MSWYTVGKRQWVLAAILAAGLGGAADGRADVLLHDDFDSFSVGTVWQSGSAWVEDSVPATTTGNVIQDGSRSVLHMASTGTGTKGGGYIPLASFSVPTASYNALRLTTVFAPLGGGGEPLEVDIWNPSRTAGARFLVVNWLSLVTWQSDRMWQSSSYEPAVSGSWTNGVYYRGIIDITSTGTTVTVALDSNPATILHTNTLPLTTRALFGDTVQIGLRQWCYGGASPVANVDWVELSATPEAGSLGLLALGALGLMRRRRN
jgi:MYXO-CTERM domain-containing protein